MAEPFLSEIRILSFKFAPKGWAWCDGQVLPISQNQTLYSLLGTTFGGNGVDHFALPDLRSRTPIHPGSGHRLGERGGEESHALSTKEMPWHTHTLNGSSADGTEVVPSGTLLAKAAPANPYHAPAGLAAMNAGSISSVGGSEPHQNMQPFLTLNFCIALQGLYPSRN